MRQMSPESLDIYDFILELFHNCLGNWDTLIGQSISSGELDCLLTYAAAFLSNLGSYFVRRGLSTVE
ncbi:hypothetical protein F5B22DRAFT_616758 [Xylaria bambusicola]|uniref:uncharacterized protein n=1 Tax=Xylaria bambusicola TaxID=326684 RepID=UPI00200726CB|nr:uncharacterized protein F5B22DRAFT_616758 [Xylaria bambusicola]KAI0509556.1 hypothetical protein F5B22DRAFT_616758 [Xylaria bambusicola]